jgi:hypothetical protein
MENARHDAAASGHPCSGDAVQKRQLKRYAHKG